MWWVMGTAGVFAESRLYDLLSRLPGHLREARNDDVGQRSEDENVKIPGVVEARQELVSDPEQHFTQPCGFRGLPGQALKKMASGRPSTYAPIISTIQQRGYVSG
jgi:DNA topoisomerase-1